MLATIMLCIYIANSLSAVVGGDVCMLSNIKDIFLNANKNDDMVNLVVRSPQRCFGMFSLIWY